MQKAWENFDAAAARMISKEITFDQFAVLVGPDIARMGRRATHLRRPPAWVGQDDVQYSLLWWCWYYAFQHRCRDGRRGFNPERHPSAGSYLRFCIQKHVQKELSRGRGESQHRRQGSSRAPEFLSKTGETGGLGGLPEIADEAPSSEDLAARSEKIERLRHFAETARDLVMLSALAQAAGDDRRVVAFLLDQPEATKKELGIADAKGALEAVDSFVDDWSKKYGAKPKAREKGTMAA